MTTRNKNENKTHPPKDNTRPALMWQTPTVNTLPNRSGQIWFTKLTPVVIFHLLTLGNRDTAVSALSFYTQAMKCF